MSPPSASAALKPVSRPGAGHGPLLSLCGVSKVFFNGTVALENLSLAVLQGEFVSLLGPSGCGKSTALRLIAGLAEPTSGAVVWPGASHDAAGGPDREIGFVFQDPTLMPWATVFDNVWLPLRLKGVGKASARGEVISALALVGLDGWANAYPRELSGGMKMRVSIARALVTRPRLLLMDEPFASLDEITRFKLNDDLLSLWQRFGWTVIFVTHSVFEAVYLSGRLVVMAARPGRAFREVTIDAPYPRDETFRTTDVYAEQCRKASEALRAAMAASEELMPARARSAVAEERQ